MAIKRTATDAHVALLRGINVGGKNMLPMKRLIATFEAAGCDDVSTFIQSGNVIFRTPPSAASKRIAAVSKSLADEFGYRGGIVVRSAAELRRVARDNPFVAAGEDPNSLHVMFLSTAPGRAKLATLDPDRSPGDRFEARGSEIYLCLPKGVARTKLSNAYFDAKLAVISTGRNWRTVLKLCDLTG